MQFDELDALSPVDGRYRSKTNDLAAFFSESALIKYRIRVEIEYFLSLSQELPALKDLLQHHAPEEFRSIYKNFTLEDAKRVKEIESVTNHDVKAIEYFIKEQFDRMKIGSEREYVHFGLTSQDINNTSFPMMLFEAMDEVYMPALMSVRDKIKSLADEWSDIPMLAKTHGQPASPTHLGKELDVFVYRLDEQIKQLKAVPRTGKFGGATGNFNAHQVAYPDHDWTRFAEQFMNVLGLEREKRTTQISNYDNTAAVLDALSRIDDILIDFSRDVWMYVSMNYFKQKIKKGEVGSSAMPHKVNPIDFENAEGNLGLAIALQTQLARKLPISRLQRDLTDSTVIRNIGMPLAYGIIALKSLLKGLNKLLLNKEAIDRDLEQNWAVVAEAIQTILRREGYPNPYEALKALTRTGEAVSEQSIKAFIESLDVEERVKDELRVITPYNYVGII
ncbi:MAG: adenylosuccinate lyase [Porphyromonadaceae bacterium]|nr:adenylosuccinate lyase [Porphyromonadaceae bacterium]